MSNNPEPPTYGRVPKSRKEEKGEYGPGKTDIVMCKDCKAVYYYKSWKHNLRHYKHLSQDKAVQFAVCPACQMERDGTFEGQVIVENIPKGIHRELLQLVENIGERARKRDLMDRILKIQDYRNNGLEILTSENQLAVSIGKQIVRAHKGATITIQWSDKESVARVHVNLRTG